MELPNIAKDHKELEESGYEKQRLPASRNPRVFKYKHNQLYELEWIKMKHSEQKKRTVTYTAGTFALVNVQSKEGEGRGGAYASSVAKILGLFEDKQGRCYVALHYFWRFGQIHASYDLHTATAPPSKHQIFLQKEHLKYPVPIYGQWLCTPVRYDDGKYVELLSAQHLEGPVTVQHISEVERNWGGLDGYLAGYQCFANKDQGAVTDRFWFDSMWDHSSYAFEQCDAEGNPVAATNRIDIAKEELTMLDTFCGLGSVSLAARTVGMTVVGGVDVHGEAISSYNANTMEVTTGNDTGTATLQFNPEANVQPKGFHMKVEELVEELESCRRVLPPIYVLHASPPCQNVSSKKDIKLRIITGEEVRAIVRLVELLQPAYFTLEEVPGFVCQKFLRSNLRGALAHWPDYNPAAAADLATVEQPNQQQEESSDSEGLTAGGNDTSDDEDDVSSVVNKQSNSQTGDSDKIQFCMIVMLVAKLVGMRYTVKLGLVQAADFGVPQMRWRVVMVATKCGYQVAELPKPWCKRPEGIRRPLTAKDPNFCIGQEESVSWPVALEVVADDDATLAPHITVAEAIGDLPSLTELKVRENKLGLDTCEYDATKGIMLTPVPVEGLMGGGPRSAYSAYMRGPTAARFQATFQAGWLLGHRVEHRQEAIDKLIATSDSAEDRRDRRSRGKASWNVGHRVAADGVSACVLSHVEPRKTCLHPLEDRYFSLLERRRLQSLPDWVKVRGSPKEQELQVGNAVPFLLAVAIMGEVYAAATQTAAYKLPILHGPALSDDGIADEQLKEEYLQWVQQNLAEGRDDQLSHEALQECRTLLSLQADRIKQQNEPHQQLPSGPSGAQGSSQQHRREEVVPGTASGRQRRRQQQSLAGPSTSKGATAFSGQQQRQLPGAAAAPAGRLPPQLQQRQALLRAGGNVAAAVNSVVQQNRLQHTQHVGNGDHLAAGGDLHQQLQGLNFLADVFPHQQQQQSLAGSRLSEQNRPSRKRGREEHDIRQQQQQEVQGRERMPKRSSVPFACNQEAAAGGFSEEEQSGLECSTEADTPAQQMMQQLLQHTALSRFEPELAAGVAAAAGSADVVGSTPAAAADADSWHEPADLAASAEPELYEDLFADAMFADEAAAAGTLEEDVGQMDLETVLAGAAAAADTTAAPHEVAGTSEAGVTAAAPLGAELLLPGATAAAAAGVGVQHRPGSAAAAAAIAAGSCLELLPQVAAAGSGAELLPEVAAAGSGAELLPGLTAAAQLGAELLPGLPAAAAAAAGMVPKMGSELLPGVTAGESELLPDAVEAAADLGSDPSSGGGLDEAAASGAPSGPGLPSAATAEAAADTAIEHWSEEDQRGEARRLLGVLFRRTANLGWMA